MSVLTVVQTKASNDFKAAANYKSATCTAVGSGNSLIFIITALTAELPFVIEPQAYNGCLKLYVLLSFSNIFKLHIESLLKYMFICIL